jgi:transposase
LTIVVGLDQHRAQITCEWLDTGRGEVQGGRVVSADWPGVRGFLDRFRGQELEVALEGTTGWRFVVEELYRIGAVVHLAEPAETAGLRGPKKRAKSDRADARHLRELLMLKRLPESWIPPEHIRAVLYHHGWAQHRAGLMTADGREWLAGQQLPEAAREQVAVAVAMIDGIDRQMAPVEKKLRAYARRQAGCMALMRHYGIGELAAVTILAELGDVSRFSSSRQAVRFAGLDVTVNQSDQRRAPGHISRQGPPALRWALYEAAQVARRGERSPDRAYYLATKDRIGGNRACIAVARKLLKRSYHTLRELGEEALAPA